MTAPAGGAPALRSMGPRRPVVGMSAVLLPLAATGAVDWASFEGLLRRTLDAGLTPAVNMDTGYVQLIDTATRARVLDLAASVCGPGAFVAVGPDQRRRGRHERQGR